MKIDVKVMQMFIDQMVGIPKFSYPARQVDAPKPADEFAHIRLLEEYQIGIPNVFDIKQVDGSVIHRTVSPVRLRFRVGVVETDGTSASKIMHKWTTEPIKALMISTGFGFISCEPLSNEDALLEKEWEIRDGFSIEMYSTRVYEEVSASGDFIKSVNINGRYVFGDTENILLRYEINN